MKTQTKISLPFWETVGRSFMYAVRNWELFCKTAALGLVALILEMFGGFPTLCGISGGDCAASVWGTLSNWAMLLVSVAVIINYCRGVVLKTQPDFMSGAFLLRMVKYLWVSLLFSLAAVLILVVLSMSYAGIGKFFGINDVNMLPLLILLIFCLIGLAPIFLVYAAVSVDDKTLGFKEAYLLTKGNYNKIFWGQVLLLIPCALIMLSVSMLYRRLGVESYMIKTVFATVLVAVSLFDSCIKAAFFAHIYQYFTFYRNKSVKAAVKTVPEAAPKTLPASTPQTGKPAVSKKTSAKPAGTKATPKKLPAKKPKAAPKAIKKTSTKKASKA